jgi:hypothetical protein
MLEDILRDQTIGVWLEALASSAPAPGGGAAAALNAAIGAALIEMACNLTIGRPRYAQHEGDMRAALAQATKLRGRALQSAADDVRTFGAVSEAYKLPKETDEQRQARMSAKITASGISSTIRRNSQPGELVSISHSFYLSIDRRSTGSIRHENLSQTSRLSNGLTDSRRVQERHDERGGLP